MLWLRSQDEILSLEIGKLVPNYRFFTPNPFHLQYFLYPVGKDMIYLA